MLRRHVRDRGASPIPFIIFLLLWLVACYVVYKYQQEHDKATKLLVRKKVAKLKLGETIPDIRDRSAALEARINDMKQILGYGPGGAADVAAQSIPTDVVVKGAKEKLDLYHDHTMPGSEGAHISKRGEKDVELKINGNWIAVPLMGEAVKIDKLKDKQYRLNLESVSGVLLVLHDRLARYRKTLNDNIARKEAELKTLRSTQSVNTSVVQQRIGKAKAQIETLKGEKSKVEGEFTAKIEAAEETRRELENQAADIEEQYKRTIQVGKKDIQTYRNKIQEANRQKANLRERAAEARTGSRKARISTSAAELIRATIETDEPDGEVSYSTPDGVFVNLGRADKVKPGLKFFVYAQAAAGGWRYRGKIEVYKVVKDHIGQARILHLSDKFNPLTRGDKIFNKVFRTPAEMFAKGPTRLTFMGEFPRHKDSMKYIKSQLKRFGVDVQDKLTHWTEIVVVDKKFEQLDEFVTATRDLNCEVMTIDQLKEFIHY